MKRTIVAAWIAGGIIAAVPVLAQQQTSLQRLRASIERTTRSVNATWGIYIKSLETNEEIALDADSQMETMSTIKIPLMVEVFEQIKGGKFKLTDKYTFVQADSQPGTGTIQRLDPGAVMTVKDLITMMIIDDVGVLEADGRTIVISIFTGNHFGSGEALENAIGLVAKDVGDYFAYRQ